jgi:hypothetical protein
LTPDGYLPRADVRGNAATAPPMDLMGPLAGRPAAAIVAGDVRANENIALTALHTLFAREHNRIVAALPRSLSDEAKFQLARRVVGAELQYVTYHEFLPALGVRLHRYRGYSSSRNAGISNEFAVVGYRAHSMIHGEFEAEVPAARYSAQRLAAFRAAGLMVEQSEDASRSRFRSTWRSATRACCTTSASIRSWRASPSGSTETTSRSTMRCGACSSRFRGRAFPIPPCAVFPP